MIKVTATLLLASFGLLPVFLHRTEAQTLKIAVPVSCCAKYVLGSFMEAWFLAGALAQIYPDIQVYSQPMLFRSYEEVAYVRSQIDPQLIRSLEAIQER